MAAALNYSDKVLQDFDVSGFCLQTNIITLSFQGCNISSERMEDSGTLLFH